ncbi:MAG: type II toxin-antitoxin system RelE/ParE family toxin [Oscillospiraceae bacterium]|nr:type II toxin-antitoxin system RelE/ParE family toxin [Oscillospiraceae bacterium]
MTREFIRLFEFEKQCQHIGLIEDDILSVEIRILLNPACGVMIQGTGGIRKLRVAFNNKGKSGGARVIYIDFAGYNKTYFITVYAKGEMDNLSQAERNELKELVKILKNELRKQEK